MSKTHKLPSCRIKQVQISSIFLPPAMWVHAVTCWRLKAVWVHRGQDVYTRGVHQLRHKRVAHIVAGQVIDQLEQQDSSHHLHIHIKRKNKCGLSILLDSSLYYYPSHPSYHWCTLIVLIDRMDQVATNFILKPTDSY